METRVRSLKRTLMREGEDGEDGDGAQVMAREKAVGGIGMKEYVRKYFYLFVYPCNAGYPS